MASLLVLQPRYIPLYTPEGVELAEINYVHRHLDWELPLEQVALVCLDVWANHFSRDTLERVDSITTDRIAPLVNLAREKGLTVIHAPGPLLAGREKNRVQLLPMGSKPQPTWPDSPLWPPQDFRDKTGDFQQFERPFKKDAEDRDRWRLTGRQYHPAVLPQEGEPIIANGEELHRLCAQREILVLLYVGFNANFCMVNRDYGLYEMNKRGYEIVLLRDCTTGMETAETADSQACTVGHIETFEQAGISTLTARELTQSLAELRD